MYCMLTAQLLHFFQGPNAVTLFQPIRAQNLLLGPPRLCIAPWWTFLTFHDPSTSPQRRSRALTRRRMPTHCTTAAACHSRTTLTRATRWPMSGTTSRTTSRAESGCEWRRGPPAPHRTAAATGALRSRPRRWPLWPAAAAAAARVHMRRRPGGGCHARNGARLRAASNAILLDWLPVVLQNQRALAKLSHGNRPCSARTMHTTPRTLLAARARAPPSPLPRRAAPLPNTSALPPKPTPPARTPSTHASCAREPAGRPPAASPSHTNCLFPPALPSPCP